MALSNDTSITSIRNGAGIKPEGLAKHFRCVILSSRSSRAGARLTPERPL